MPYKQPKNEKIDMNFKAIYKDHIHFTTTPTRSSPMLKLMPRCHKQIKVVKELKYYKGCQRKHLRELYNSFSRLAFVFKATIKEYKKRGRPANPPSQVVCLFSGVGGEFRFGHCKRRAQHSPY